MDRNLEGGTARAGMTSLPLSCIIMNFFVPETDALEKKYGMERGMRSGMPLVVCSVVKQLYRFFHLVTHGFILLLTLVLCSLHNLLCPIAT